MSPAKPASPVQQPSAAEQWHAGGPLTASSSGSTGVSKLFTYQRAHVIHAIEASAAHFGWPTGRAFTAWTPLAPQGIGARMMVWRALHLGWTLLESEARAKPTLPAEAVKSGVNFAATTPHQARYLFESGELWKINLLLLGGESLNAEFERELLAMQGNLSQTQHPSTDIRLTFGMAETLSHIAERPIGCPHFQVLPGVDVSVVGGTEGELAVVAPLRGIQKKLVTRDRVRILTSPAGAFEWLGRIDNVINTGGVKVQPERLEALLAGAVTEAGGGRFYIVGRPHPTTGQQVVLVLAADDPADEHTILSACAAALPSLLHPQRPRAIERRRLMYTATGKICRN